MTHMEKYIAICFILLFMVVAFGMLLISFYLTLSFRMNA